MNEFQVILSLVDNVQVVFPHKYKYFNFCILWRINLDLALLSSHEFFSRLFTYFFFS